MKYLLDTHAAVWALEESPHLSPRVRDLILDRSPADFVIADVTILEVACLIRSSRLPRKEDPVARLEKLCALFLPVRITTQIAWRAASLDWAHRDPADRLICATALEHDLILVTRARKITEWGAVPVFIVFYVKKFSLCFASH
ncbi:hypothetical protein AXK11_07580 [Cephaloticoccus primus]|uniref:Ribonuclease VapC n=1 Tax=Cephaloticoccus primus TaxID=1548207 RepID=A0A139SK40_9BACT|nr:type II toxin-antitoxin system VapC family toxin [Cephaloticoccus primus]KXU34939.1 hypothetical protein AXK11_07580 [Cephaloticoccus primus]